MAGLPRSNELPRNFDEETMAKNLKMVEGIFSSVPNQNYNRRYYAPFETPQIVNLPLSGSQEQENSSSSSSKEKNNPTEAHQSSAANAGEETSVNNGNEERDLRVRNIDEMCSGPSQIGLPTTIDTARGASGSQSWRSGIRVRDVVSSQLDLNAPTGYNFEMYETAESMGNPYTSVQSRYTRFDDSDMRALRLRYASDLNEPTGYNSEVYDTVGSMGNPSTLLRNGYTRFESDRRTREQRNRRTTDLNAPTGHNFEMHETAGLMGNPTTSVQHGYTRFESGMRIRELRYMPTSDFNAPTGYNFERNETAESMGNPSTSVQNRYTRFDGSDMHALELRYASDLNAPTGYNFEMNETAESMGNPSVLVRNGHTRSDESDMRAGQPRYRHTSDFNAPTGYFEMYETAESMGYPSISVRNGYPRSDESDMRVVELRYASDQRNVSSDRYSESDGETASGGVRPTSPLNMSVMFHMFTVPTHFDVSGAMADEPIHEYFLIGEFGGMVEESFPQDEYFIIGEYGSMGEVPNPPTEDFLIDAFERALADYKVCCQFCRKNGEPYSQYSTHVLKDSSGKICCPILMDYVCPKCGSTGESAHTSKYCIL